MINNKVFSEVYTILKQLEEMLYYMKLKKMLQSM